MYELSLAELESELAAVLPARTLLRRRRGGTHARAAFGSVANANSTHQSISNPQIAAVTDSRHTDIDQRGDNDNHNTNTQFGVPVNFFG